MNITLFDWGHVAAFTYGVVGGVMLSVTFWSQRALLTAPAPQKGGRP